MIKKIKKTLKREFCFFTSRPKRVLFDHLPKCGGTTVNDYLRRNFPGRKTYSLNGINYLQDVDKFKNLDEDSRQDYYLILGHEAHQLRDHVQPDSYKFTILREPVDRIVSHYFYAKRNTEHFLYKQIHAESISLEDYTKLGISDELTNWYTCHFSDLSPTQVVSDPEQALATAMETIADEYDLVGFQDDIANCLAKLQADCNLCSEYLPAEFNKTKDRKEISQLSNAEKAAIESTNAIDMQLFKKLKEVYS